MNEQRQQPLIHGSYRICQRLGKGGEAEVYLVEYLPTEQLRAAKVIYTEHPKRQMHELNMMKHLHHRALPQIIDIFRVDGQVWLIMEYIRGRSLTEAVRQGLGEEQLFQIACELAEVLIYLHSRERPIYHLDIKPSNILLKRDGHLVLLDFGAAIRPDMEMGLQQFGTPGFAAPEQQNAPGTALDARADIYGFGATLYYCLHGAVPGDRSAVRNAKGRTWQHPLDQILAKCLQERKEDRYPTAESLYQDLCRLRRSAGRRKKRRAAAFAVLFFLVVVLFSAVMLSQKEESEEITPKERYDQLLKQAEGLGLSQAVPYYEKAALLQMTGDWSLELLDRMMEDYLFTAEEERVLTTLLYLSDGETGRTVSETMQEKPALYGSFAYRLGLAYWYFYEESGGRSAAASWFARAVDSQENGSVETEAAAEFSGDQIAAEDKEKEQSGEQIQQESEAVQTGEQIQQQETETERMEVQTEAVEETIGQPDWLESARIHAELSGYYETLGRQDINGVRQMEYATCWEDLKRLWQLDSLQQESAGIRQQVADELLSCLIMGSYEIRQSGTGQLEVEEVLESVRAFLWEEATGLEDTEMEVIQEQYRDAAAAVERVFADEGGLVIHEEESEETSAIQESTMQ